MPQGQRQIHKLVPGVGLVALLVLACARPPQEPGLHFEDELVDFGRLDAGPSLPLAFTFVNGPVELIIRELETSCGCVEPSLVVEGAVQALPARIPAGARGEVRALYRTEGYSGRKLTGLTLFGDGPGLPRQLRVDSILDSWLTLTPSILDFGAVDGLTERAAALSVSGRGDFRLTAVLGGSPDLRVEGLPSASSARSQEFRVVLLPTAEEGRHAAFLNLGSDAGFSLRVPVVYEVQGVLWTVPGSKLMLGEIPAGRAASAAIEVGAREGRLEPPEVEILGLEGARATVRSLPGESRYRVDLTIPEHLPAGAFSARIRLSLRHHLQDGVEETVREVRLFGVVASGT
jgi:hypothetical protein